MRRSGHRWGSNPAWPLVCWLLTVSLVGCDRGSADTFSGGCVEPEFLDEELPPELGEGEFSLAEADAKLVGQRGTHFGSSLDGGGDVDGDGFDDFVVGAPEDGEGGAYSGAVFLFTARVEGLVEMPDAAAKLVGVAPEDEAGWGVAIAGDTDGDGLSDVLVGAPGAEAAYLVLGGVQGTVSLADAHAILSADAGLDGVTVATPGDIDGDGLDDLLLGAIYGSMQLDTFLVSGQVSGTVEIADAQARFESGTSGYYTPDTVSPAGDLDGDGHPDLLIGAPGKNIAYLMYGPFSGDYNLATGADTTWNCSWISSRLGTAAAVAPDLDGDGVDDLVMATPGYSYDVDPTGAAALVLSACFETECAPPTGDLDVAELDTVYTGGASTDLAGYSLAVGDFDGDGETDLALGAPERDEDCFSTEHDSCHSAGGAYVHFGSLTEAPNLSQAHLVLAGERYYDRAGTAIANAGDTDGDGRDELLVGAPDESRNGEDAGAVYVIRSW